MLKLIVAFGPVALFLGGCQFIPGTYDYAVREGKEAVAMTFADPSSTQFKDVLQMHTVLNDQPNVSVCGVVNTKNLMGAYTGYKRFVFNKGRTLIDPQSANDAGEYVSSLTKCNAAMESDRRLGLYGTSLNTRVTCKAVDDVYDRSHLQGVFEEIYANNCGEHLTTEENRRFGVLFGFHSKPHDGYGTHL